MLPEAEVLLADLAADQWGLMTSAQAVAAGVGRMQLSRMDDAGLLSRVTHGVYALRGSLGEKHLELAAAWLGLDPARPARERLVDPVGGAVVSHASAAVLHGLGDLDADRHEFTLSRRKQTRRSDVRLHRGTLDAGEVTRVDGLPVTTPVRTIADLLADGHDGGHVAGVLADAVRGRRVDLRNLAVRVGPYAARYGLGRGDGEGFVAHLLELGGATAQADADRLVDLARAHRVTIGDLVTISDPAWVDQVARIAAAVLAKATVQPSEVSDAAAVTLRAVVTPMEEVRSVQNAEVLRQVGAAVSAQIATINRAIAPVASAAIAAALRDVHQQRWALSPVVAEALQPFPARVIAEALQGFPPPLAGADRPGSKQEPVAEDD